MVEAEVSSLNEQLSQGGNPFRLAVVDVSAIDLLKKNARFMTSETYKNLVENIKRDGALASVPFCVKKADRYLCLSGNHRVQAAKDAGVTRILILFTERELSREEEVSIQLSHNAIAGQDDFAVLKSLWDEIEDVALKYYAGLDDATLKELEKVGGSGLSAVRLDFKAVTFLFLPEEADRLDKALAETMSQALAGSDGVHLAAHKEFDRLLRALEKVKKRHQVKNSAVAVTLLLDEWEQADRLIEEKAAQDTKGKLETETVSAGHSHTEPGGGGWGGGR